MLIANKIGKMKRELAKGKNRKNCVLPCIQYFIMVLLITRYVDFLIAYSQLITLFDRKYKMKIISPITYINK
jgi:hypothetical protein